MGPRLTPGGPTEPAPLTGSDTAAALVARGRASIPAYAALALVCVFATTFAERAACLAQVVGLVLGITVVRWGNRAVLARQPESVLARATFQVLALAAGAAWGGLVAFALSTRATWDADCLVLLVCTAGLGAGAAPSLSPALWTLRGYLCLVLLPVIGMAFAHGGRQGAGLAIGVTFFLGYLSLLGGELRRDFATSLLSARALEARAVEAERLARDLERASALARAASDAKSAFVANVSHELRTPLVSILGYADLLRSSAPGPEERDRSEVIHRNAKHLLALLNQVLDLSKVEAGRMTAEDRETNLRDLFEDIEQTFFLPAQEKGLGFEIRGEGAIPLYVRTDGTRLRQIVLNLTANAIKFTQQGKVQVVPSYEAASERLAVRIIDTGIGMTEGVRAQIFAPFAQADASIARQFGGTGLGLHLSRELARLLGGDVDVESSPDAGSTFTAWIRAAAAGAATCSIAPKTASAPRRQASRPLELHGMSILLAEDNADNQRLLSLQLAAAGAHVDVASDGEQVLELVARAGAPYDVILMDVQMPRLDGLEATRRLRASGYGGAVVALSAHVFAEERERMIAAGCDDCLGKPITRDDLVLAVRARRAPATAAIAPDATTDDSIPAGAEEEDVAEMLAVLREDFVRGLTATLVRLREAASRSDVTEIAYVAHQLRGAGGSFGFPEITRAGAQLEDSARGGRAIDAALAALERACDTAQQGSTALRSSPTR